MQQVLGEFHVVVGEGTPDVVALAAPALHQFLELGHDDVVAALAAGGLAEAVVDLLPAVQTQYHVVHFFVGKLDDIIVDEHAVGGEGKAELLVMNFLLLPAVGHQLLHHIPVHEGLAAEEVHLQVPAAAGVGDEEVQGLLAHLKAHEGTLALVLALACKAVLAGEVAGVGHMKAQRLDDGVARLEVKGQMLVGVGGKQLALGLQVLRALQDRPDLALRHLRLAAVLFQHGGNDLPGAVALVHGDDVIGQVVHHMDGAAVHIQHDIITIELITVDHSFTLSLYS